MPGSSVESIVMRIGELLAARNQTVTAVESCTGGGLCRSFTMIPGSSAWFGCGFVTYSDSAKSAMVGVPEDLIGQFGAVSCEVARSMALGGRLRSGADYAVSVTGIAGPGGGVPGKPVGTVCFGWASGGNTCRTESCRFDGRRTDVREQSVEYALARLLELLESCNGSPGTYTDS